jgi:hypothetical protein
MQNAKILKILFPAMLLMGIGYWFYGNYSNPDKIAQELLIKKELLKKTEVVWDLWVNGKEAKLFKESKDCHAKAAGDGRCSIDLLNCVLPKSNLRIDRKGKNKVEFFKIEPANSKRVWNYTSPVGSRVVMGILETKLTLFLESSCNKIFLPKRHYAIGPKKNPGLLDQFDNLQSNIFIDKEMTEAQGRLILDMKDHCAKRGMQLLESHILDAASFHPVDLRNNRPKYFLQPPLPWTRNFKSEYIYSAQNDENFMFEKKYCNFIYSKECKDFQNESLPSWMGLKNPLGSLIEVVRNPIEPKKKLIPSSIYYSIHSKWHSLGKRASWSGDSYHRDEFDFSLFKNPVEEKFEELKLGFRCMQEEFLK